MKWMNVGIFVVLMWAAFYLGKMLIDYLSPVIPFLFTGMIGEAMAWVFPGVILFLGIKMYGKKLVS